MHGFISVILLITHTLEKNLSYIRATLISASTYLRHANFKKRETV